MCCCWRCLTGVWSSCLLQEYVFWEDICSRWACLAGLCRSNHLSCCQFRHLGFFFLSSVFFRGNANALLLIWNGLVKPTVLTLYNPKSKTKISADASSYGLGLGAVLLQEQSGNWKPVAYASSAMSET